MSYLVRNYGNCEFLFFISFLQTTWVAGFLECDNSYGADLVGIETEEENAFIRQLIIANEIGKSLLICVNHMICMYINLISNPTSNIAFRGSLDGRCV